MKKEPKREEIRQEDKWDLESMYPSIEEWNKDYEKAQVIEEELLKYKGHLLDDAKTLYNYLKDSDELDIILENLIIYANMKSDEDTANTKYITLKGKIENLEVKQEEFNNRLQEEIDKYRVEKCVYQLKPGITGYAQVNGRDLLGDEVEIT